MLIGRRNEYPLYLPEAERQIREWARAFPEDMRTLEEASPYSVMAIPTGEQDDLLFTTRNVDPVRAAEEARRTGLWINPVIRDTLWPPEVRRARPLMPLRQGHMAMLIAAGFLDNLCLETNGRRILVKGKTTKSLELVSHTEDEEVWQDRMYTTIRTLDLDTGEIQDVETKGRRKPRTEE